MIKNINIAWAEWLIEDCVRHGIKHFCLAPGSRSAPLSLAVAQHPDCISHCHFDERGLGFFALGLARAKQQPVVVITTSGSAVANLYPAVVEARQNGVPLVILSADRPSELIGMGANQAIQQQGIFSHYPVYQAQLSEPSLASPPQTMLTHLGHALAQQQQQAGPIHLNCPYREPFYPEQVKQDLSEHARPLLAWLASDNAYYRVQAQTINCQQHPAWLTLRQQQQILVVLGQQALAQSQAIVDWAQQAGLPVLVDCQSHWQALSSQQQMISQAELLLANPGFSANSQAKLVIQFGGKLVSKRLGQYLADTQAEHWLIDPHHQVINPSHRIQQRWHCAALAWLQAHPLAVSNAENHYFALWRHAQQQLAPLVEQAISDYSELAIVAQVSALQPPNTALFMGNSMSVRLFELLGRPCRASHYLANRGASGIDGLVASSCGVAEGLQQRCTLVIGDTSLLHDLNSLSLVAQSSQALTIVLINNNGGEIFNLLPRLTSGEQHQQLARDFFQLPHQTQFASAAACFGLAYAKVEDKQQFSDAFKLAQQSKQSYLIEVCVPSGDASARYQSLINQVIQQDAL
ncbi:2-succinyl-5-enolpyruvyl-6-hydroxy-3-cyclohexene-1-carboxylic-acid synthase [Agarivorans gilvus]|uniref:2-succinyl-5-enolpyruvyl-6-hydroxy-3-cyclohexene-1-carboxylate synthase n=1 Tax=Agarivorans gilvus TaxID=680279 RepID=A0ABQ1I3Q2_9ALTE|nr:2-succinyl-5-enolpyruvyl-6-hydroxy-3-cyclohexene-1-carboxylic-acid synthase [Agarivorans gilvus]GGB13578.1 2-succinyl-5-enolpyruvyl-6-hydroxy-3-cyclohexene-1-carboxylate synthase [Agarivorans gilvus]